MVDIGHQFGKIEDNPGDNTRGVYEGLSTLGSLR